MAHTFVVTGASRGIGQEFARQLAARGEHVIATVRSLDKAAALHALGPNVRVLPLDVADPASISTFGRALASEKIDVLINNAGVKSLGRTIAELDPTEMREVMMVNAIAPMLVVQALLAPLRAGERKTIVQITSQLASIANNTGGSSYAYRASKAALNQFNKSLANELVADGFTTVAVHPGWVATDMGGASAPLTPHDSVRYLIRTIDNLTIADTGHFLNYDGTPLPW